MNAYNMMNGMGMYNPTPQQDYLSRMNISVNNFPHEALVFGQVPLFYYRRN